MAKYFELGNESSTESHAVTLGTSLEVSIRVLTWNCNRATKTSNLWNYFSELNPDIAVLQEVSSIPLAITQNYDIRSSKELNNMGDQNRTSSALLVRGSIGEESVLHSSHEWINRELTRFAGNLPTYQVQTRDGVQLNVMGVYSPWQPINHFPNGVDTSPIKFTQNPKVYLVNLLFDSLRSMNVQSQYPWVIAGDFNLSETFDARSIKPRGNREYIDRMGAFGLTECLRQANGKLIPTYRHTDSSLIHQIDHLWVTQPLANRLVSCSTGDASRVFDKSARLSDHLPIVADFKLA